MGYWARFGSQELRGLAGPCGSSCSIRQQSRLGLGVLVEAVAGQREQVPPVRLQRLAAQRRVGPVGRALSQVARRQCLERLLRRRLGVRALAEEGRVRVEEEAGVAVVEGGHRAPALSPSR